MEAVAAVPNTLMALCLNSGGWLGGAGLVARSAGCWRCLLQQVSARSTLTANDQRPLVSCEPQAFSRNALSLRFAGGLERVKRSKALRCFVPIFSSKQYVKALQASLCSCMSSGPQCLCQRGLCH